MLGAQPVENESGQDSSRLRRRRSKTQYFLMRTSIGTYYPAPWPGSVFQGKGERRRESFGFWRLSG